MSHQKSRLAGRRIILGVTGGIAAYKTAYLIRLLKKEGADVQVLMTHAACKFITPLTLGTLSEREVLIEIFPPNEAGSWTRHVHLGLWGDIMVVAPATAQTLAKLANGLCDSMLTAVALSARCPVHVFPSMDLDMYEHPATQQNLQRLSDAGYHVALPATGELASGLVGIGRLPEPEEIVDHIAGVLEDQSGILTGKEVLVTAGPTREPIDPVRYISNPSTGTMGYAMAAAAVRQGADVTLVSGPTSLDTPDGVNRIDVDTAEEMYRAVAEHSNADIVIMAAAVADYTPAETFDRKIKKSDAEMKIALRSTRDILAGLGAEKREGQVLIGFAMETDNGEANARSKLKRKNLDWIVLNNLCEAGAGFGPDTNRVTLISEDTAEKLPLLPKAELADLLVEMMFGT
jgi:phosphopantothenoylcysteine decarboxylase/phosphopantothenate--cysteine ligase